MTFKDDDDELPPTSSAEYLTHADHGKADLQQRKAQGKGLLLGLKRALLRQQVQPVKTPNQVMRQEEKSEQKDREVDAKNDDAKPGLSATKTLDERAKEQVQGAHDTQTADALRTEKKRQEEAQRQSGQEYQQNMS